jgi:hypothetical protein
MRIKRFKLIEVKTGEAKWYRIRLYDTPVALTDRFATWTWIADSPGQRNIAGGFIGSGKFGTGISIPRYSLVEIQGKKLLISSRPRWDLDVALGECVDDS